MELVTCFGFDKNGQQINTYIFEIENNLYYFCRFDVNERWFTAIRKYEMQGSKVIQYFSDDVITNIDSIRMNISLDLLSNRIDENAPEADGVSKDIVEYYVKKYLIQKRKAKIQKILNK